MVDMSIESLKAKHGQLTECTPDMLEFLEDIIDTMEALEDTIRDLRYGTGDE